MHVQKADAKDKVDAQCQLNFMHGCMGERTEGGTHVWVHACRWAPLALSAIVSGGSSTPTSSKITLHACTRSEAGSVVITARGTESRRFQKLLDDTDVST